MVFIFPKQIRETPHKRHHKFIEYYDVRAAEAALKALNRSDIVGKRIKLEPSRPGGARRKCVFKNFYVCFFFSYVLFPLTFNLHNKYSFFLVG